MTEMPVVRDIQGRRYVDARNGCSLCQWDEPHFHWLRDDNTLGVVVTREPAAPLLVNQIRAALERVCDEFGL